MVKRYRDVRDRGGWSRGMEEYPDGGYVLLADYERLEAALREAREVLDIVHGDMEPCVGSDCYSLGITSGDFYRRIVAAAGPSAQTPPTNLTPISSKSASAAETKGDDSAITKES